MAPSCGFHVGTSFGRSLEHLVMCCFGGSVILGALLALRGFALTLGGFALSKGWFVQSLGFLTCNVMSNESEFHQQRFVQ